MGFLDTRFEDFSIYPDSDGRKSTDYFLFGYPGVKLPNLAVELHEMGFEGVTARDFYNDIFKDHLAPHRNRFDYRTGEYCGIFVEKVPKFHKNGKKMMKMVRNKETGNATFVQRIDFNRHSITQNKESLFNVINRSNNFVITSPISYAGKRRTNTNARYLFALVIEIDQIVAKTGLKELFHLFERSNYFNGKKTYLQMPRPTYIVCSGKGLHLYFLFDEPIPLFPNIVKQLTNAKNRLTKHFWNSYVTNLHKNIQYEPINQPFRVVGTTAKEKNVYAMAFRTGGVLTIDDFNYFLPKSMKIDFRKKSELSLEKAKELYPDWYERRIVKKIPLKTGKSTFQKNRAVYDSWKRRIIEGAAVGKRYYCLENLCSLAVQCDIEEEELLRDVNEIASFFDTLTVEEDNHFTQNDVISALSTYRNPQISTYRRKVEYISARTGIELPRTKRNGRTMKNHLKRARAILAVERDELVQQGKFENVGRPKKDHIVREWRAKNPFGSKADCQRETKLSRNTIRIYWDR